MTTSRAGGLHKPPWGVLHAEPIGSSNHPPLAIVALPPQTWQSLNLSLPQLGFSIACGKLGGSRRLTDEVSLAQSNSSSTTTVVPLLPQEKAT